jgi:2-oxoglutarate dehydrogenase E2 component (dihydrolipoamide succinyltransferase)
MKARMRNRRMELRLAAVAAWGLCVLCGCGQKGALFLPDHAPQPVLSAPAAAPTAPATPAAPATAPAPAAEAATAPDATTTPDTPTTRKAPRDPDPTTAR